MTREVIKEELFDELFVDLHACDHRLIKNALLLNKWSFTDISEWDIISIIYRHTHTDIHEWDLNSKGYFPKVLPCTYEQT